MSDQYVGKQRERLAALRKTDPEANLRARWRIVRTKQPKYAATRLAYVPNILRYGWAVVDVPEQGFAYTLGVHYRYGHPDFLVVAARLDAPGRKRLLDALAKDVSLGHTIACGEPVHLEESGLAVTFKRYTTKAYKEYPAGLMASFERFFEDLDHIEPESLPLVWGSARRPKSSKKTITNDR